LSAKAWTIEFRFKIHGDNAVHHADGLAFWYTKDPFQEGNVFGNKDHFEGLGVFFDTFPNGNHEVRYMDDNMIFMVYI
jgi:mannose-binding lectin 2